MTTQGWIGVDLDGTLAEYDGDVKREFDVFTDYDHPAQARWYAITPTMGNPQHHAEGPTESAAVCALLKARYGISVLRVPVRENSPHFLYEPRVTAEWSTFQMCAMPTELAAVAALARRIRGAG